MTITQERIVVGAFAIQGRSQAVTNQSVRVELGTGSFREIAPLVRSWKERQIEAEIAEIALPPMLEALALQSIRHLWTEANRRRREELHRAERFYKTHEQELLQQQEQLLTEVDRLEAEVAETDGLRGDLEHRLNLATQRAEESERNHLIVARDVTRLTGELDASRASERAAVSAAAELRGELRAARVRVKVSKGPEHISTSAVPEHST